MSVDFNKLKTPEDFYATLRQQIHNIVSLTAVISVGISEQEGERDFELVFKDGIDAVKTLLDRECKRYINQNWDEIHK
jgi:hypothetical protein